VGAVISQREARRLKKRVVELEEQKRHLYRNWGSEYPDGQILDTIEVSEVEWFICRTATKLGHPLVVRPDSSERKLLIYGMKP
jgi:hypothetical protein